MTRWLGYCADHHLFFKRLHFWLGQTGSLQPLQFKESKMGTALVASAGALSNFLIAAVFGILIRFSDDLGIASLAFINIASIVVFLNLILGVFNLIPIPPLDGSKVLFSLLLHRWRHIQNFLEQYWLFLIFFLIFFLWSSIFPVVSFLFQILTGLKLPKELPHTCFLNCFKLSIIIPMFYVYILKSRVDQKLYVGSTDILKRRLWSIIPAGFVQQISRAV